MARLKELTELDASGYVPAETYLLAEDSSEESKKVKARTLLSGVAADLSAEVTARANADTALQGSIDTITVKIPAAASDLNQLADKAFVTGITDTKAAKAESVGSFTLSMDSSTFVITLQAKDVNGSNLGSAQTIDLPLESVVVSGSYDPTSKKVILALKDGSTVEFSVADLISGLQSEITGAATSITEDNLTASKALVSDSNGKVAASSVSAAELDHLSGVTSPIQTQINGLSEAISAEVSERETVTGDLSDLTTVSKTNLVSAINEAAASGGSGSAQISVTWADLKTARDGGLLTPGQQYRITDYVTTTVQPETQSAGHQFDIIVTADSEGALNENARAAIHAGDTYFADSKLQAWKLKYCLDNDTARFAWADSANGKGVIYQMIDEFENDLPYDFKNIQFKRYKITAKTTATKPDDLVSGYYGMRSSENPASATGALYPSGYTIDTAAPVFRFTFDYNGSDYSLNKYANKSGTEWIKRCYGNEIAPYYYNQKQGLNNVVFGNTAASSENYRNRLTGARIFSNTFGNNCHYNTFGNNCHYNTFGNNCHSNTFGNFCSSNTFGNNCHSNTFAVPDGIRYFKMDSVFYFNSDDSSNLKLQFINNGNSAVTVTGLYFAGEFEDRDTATPSSVNVTVAAGATATIFSYDDSDYEDGYSYWSLSATINGRVVNNADYYD